jgi:hypothetical protein
MAGLILEKAPAAWDAIGGAYGGAAGVASVAGLTSPLGWVSTGLGILEGLGGMFGGGTEASSAQSSIGTFAPQNSVVYNKPMIDLENPIHLAVLGLLAIGAIYVYKRKFK